MTSRPSAAGLLPFLAARSAYSLLSGSPQPSRLAEAAATAGYRSLALLDEGNLYALPEFITQAERCGLKALAGTRLPLADGSWLYLWARSRAGYGRLCELLSLALATRPECAGSDAGFAGLPASAGGRGGAAARLPVSSSGGAVDFDPVAGLLAGGWEGVYVACTGRDALQRFAEAAGCVSGSAGGEGAADSAVAGRRGPVAGAAIGEGGDVEQVSWFAALVQGTPIRDLALFARGLGLPLLAVVDSPWLDAEDAARGRLLRAVRERRTVAELFGSDGIWAAGGGAGSGALEGGGPDSLLLPPPEQAARSYSAWPDALANAFALAESCAAAATFLSPVPVFPAYQDQSAMESLAVLRRACVEQLPRRYPDARPRQAAAQRLERELAIIAPKGFSAYFLLVRDIVGLCPRTCGRGSAASSVVSYLLGITHVDPVAHDLFFERFLNEGRTDPPDIDIDFPWDEREQVLRQVFEQWPGASAMVADHCCFRGRGRIRETALAFGKSEAECGQLTRAWLHGGPEAVPPELAQAAALLKDMPRYIGTHPGGVVITPRPTAWYSHVQANSFGYPVLALEKDVVEQAGLVKIDLLGNRSLSVLLDCIELVNTQRGATGGQTTVSPAGDGQAENQAAVFPDTASLVAEAAGVALAEAGGCDSGGLVAESGGQGRGAAGGGQLDWGSFNPLKEPEPRRLVESGKTIGIFYIESPATRQLLQKMRTADFEHLVIASSIIRPAANKYINEYVQRLHGKAWPPLAPEVEEVLHDTLGIMVYQEDVSRVAMAAAGFSAAEADTLRKILAKKRGAPLLAELRGRFYTACAGNGLAEAVVDELWTMMESFAGYSFCKAHSASYALVSYRLAWMKYWYPGHFICSVINNGGGFYDTQTYLDEAVRLGFTLLPVCVNHSDYKYKVEAVRRLCIRVGLCQLQGAARDTLLAVVDERQRRGSYTTFPEFLRRVAPALDDCRALVRSGALDALAAAEGYSRPELLWLYHQWVRRSGGQGSRRRIAAAGGLALRRGSSEPMSDAATGSLAQSGCSRSLAASAARRLGGMPGGGGLCGGGAGRGEAVQAAELFESWTVPPVVHDYSPAQKLRDELQFLGVIVSRDLAGIFRQRAAELAARRGWPEPVGSGSLTGRIGRRVCLMGVHTACKEVRTVGGESMCFKSFTDSDGVFETVLFPKVYTQIMPILECNTVFLLLGTVHVEFGALSVHIEAVDRLNRSA